jgi:anti-sigma regulatory factor (Ser/Thr protein kinase)
MKDLTVTEEFSLRNALGELPVANARLDSFAARCDLPEALTLNLKLIFDEVLTNIIQYAYTDDGRHDIRICLARLDRRLVLTFSDDGVPFNPITAEKPDMTAPLEQREIGGLGIHLVRKLVEEASYERRAGWNVLTLVKQLDHEGPG